MVYLLTYLNQLGIFQKKIYINILVSPKMIFKKSRNDPKKVQLRVWIDVEPALTNNIIYV